MGASFGTSADRSRGDAGARDRRLRDRRPGDARRVLDFPHRAARSDPTDSTRLVRPYCVNFVLAFEQRGRLRVALEEEVPFVSFSWGVDRRLIKLAHDAGDPVLVQVGDLADAIHAADANADVLIVQGIEAGGHVEGRMPIVELVKRVRAAVSSPLVAAGGIGESAATARARAAGADALAWGTPFLAAHEADVHPEYLSQLIDAEATDTALATAFDEGWPDAAHRVIRNTTVRDWSRRDALGKVPDRERVT